VDKLELRVPRDRDGRFSAGLFERHQHSEKALVSPLAEMYVQGLSTRKVKAITQELCGHSFSASAVSAINKGPDQSLSEFAHRLLDEPYPYLILKHSQVARRYMTAESSAKVMTPAVAAGELEEEVTPLLMAS